MMSTILFWCGAAIVCAIALALCITIVGATIFEIRKLFRNQTTIETPPRHPNCRHTFIPFSSKDDEHEKH